MVRTRYGDLYTGVAVHVDRRIDEHRRGVRGAKALRSKGPLELAYHVPIGDRGEALRVEARVKRLPKAHKEFIAAAALDRDDLYALLS